MSKEQRYFIVQETRPHTDAPHIKWERYLSNDDALESAFVAATRFNSEQAAANAMYRHGVEISNQQLRYPAPPKTKLEVIECVFKVARQTTVAEIVEFNNNDC